MIAEPNVEVQRTSKPITNMPSASMTTNSTVLVVDDEPIGLEVVKALLGSSDYALHCASNGQEALTKTEQLRPDLILLDVLMPGMSGYDVCRKIRSTPHLADIPIILLTALNDRDAKLRGLQSGADDFISKPFDRLELSARVRTILRLNRYSRLNSERAKFEWVVDSADDGFFIVNTGDEITYANPEARRFLGLPEGSGPITKTFLELAKQQYQCQPVEAWEYWPAPLAEGTRHLVRPLSDSSSSLWLQVDFMQDNAIAQDSYLIRLRDVTADINQQRLRWSFHSQIQHKFRNPLAVLNGYLEMLNGDTDNLNSEQQLLVDSACRASRLLSTELLSVLDYVTMAAEGTPTADQCSVADIIDIAERLDAQLDDLTLDLFSQFHVPQAAKLPLSTHQIETILWELFENAKKFHPQGMPNVAISLRSIITQDQSPNMLHLQIKDNGLSLTPEQLRQIWTPYYQAEQYYTGQVPGMGLGLSMIAATIWNLGGTCKAQNRTDKAGLVIEFNVPLVKPIAHQSALETIHAPLSTHQRAALAKHRP